MIFSSMFFAWVFLPITLAGSFLLQVFSGNKGANVFLLISSLFFYAWGEPVYIFLMLFSITINWLSGLLLGAVKHKKTILGLDVIINLALLGYFKYAGMVVRSFNYIAKADIPIPEIPLPIGISFFTFQALSYVIDVYRKEVNVQKNWFNLALYVSFFLS